jgi:hypothetical protein
MVHCYESFQKLPQKVDNDISVLHCETEKDSLLSSAKKNSEKKKTTRLRNEAGLG